MQVNEVKFDSLKRELGEVNFSKTKLSDAHIKEAIKIIAKAQGVPETSIHDKIKVQMDEFKLKYDATPVLYSTIYNNIVEDIVFTEMNDTPAAKVEGAPEFDNVTFVDLDRIVKRQHAKSLFPLKHVQDTRKKKEPRIITVPTKNEANQKKYGDTPTASAYPDGTFVFSIPFCQSLIDFAYLKKVKGPDSKYESQGGDIPDSYCYLEFLILHEYMHFVHADFHNMSVYKLDPTIVNWVGDFRSNYMLVKAGHPQLPMGLFNDNINLDRQHTFREMYNIVKAEMDKLPKDEQEKVKKALNRMGDEHQQEEPDNKGKPAPSEKDVDEHNKKVKEKIENDKGEDGKPSDEEGDGRGERKKETFGKGKGGPGGTNGAPSEFSYDHIRPTYTWQQLLRKMVTSQSTDSYETYQKPARRSVTNAEIGRQMGAAAVKPGEVLKDAELKIGFLVDSSGSMSNIIDKIYANIDKLLSSKTGMSQTFWLIKYSSSHEMYLCNNKRRTYAKVQAIGEAAKMESGNIKQLFSRHIGSGTTFNEALVEDANKIVKKKFNIVMFSDRDILDNENWKHFESWYKTASNQIFTIFDSRETWIQVCQKMKSKPNGFTYFSE